MIITVAGIGRSIFFVYRVMPLVYSYKELDGCKAGIGIYDKMLRGGGGWRRKSLFFLFIYLTVGRVGLTGT